MQLGHYQLGEKLGEGGMGAVFRAWDPNTGRHVAIKRLPVEAALRPEELERFRREGEAVAHLGAHANIVQVHALDQQGATPFLVMDLVVGESLSARIRRGPLAPDEALAIARALASALEHAHGKGILHRDVKPANVLLRADDGVPLLTDFGLAKDLTAQKERLTKTGQTLGTPSYMSPEQAGGELELLSPATDVYGLGATLYAMLAGQPPFVGQSVINTLKAVLTRDPQPPSTHEPSVPAALDRVCLKAMAKDPRERYPSAAALVEDLDRFERGELVEAKAQGASGRLFLAAGALGLAVAALALAVLLPATPGQPTTTGSPPKTDPPPKTPNKDPEPPSALQLPLRIEHNGCKAVVFLDENRLVTSGAGGAVVWGLQATGAKKLANLGDGFCTALGLWPSSAGLRLVTGSSNGWLRVFDAEGFEQLADQRLAGSEISHLAIRGDRLAASVKNHVFLVDLALPLNVLNGPEGRRFPKSVHGLCFSSDGARLVGSYEPPPKAQAQTQPGRTFVLDATRSELPEIDGNESELRSALAYGGGWLSGTQRGQITPLHVSSEQRLTPSSPLDGNGASYDSSGAILVTMNGPVRGLARLPDGRLVGVCGRSENPRRRKNELRVWSAAGNLEHDVQRDDAAELNQFGLAVSPSGQRLAIALSAKDGAWGGAELREVPPPAAAPAGKALKAAATFSARPQGNAPWPVLFLEHHLCRDALLLDDRHAITAGDGGLRCWDLWGPDGPSLAWKLDLPLGAQRILHVPSEGLLLVGDAGMGINKLPGRRHLRVHALPGRAPVFSPIELAGGQDAAIEEFVDLGEGEAAVGYYRTLQRLNMNTGELRSAGYLPGRLIALAPCPGTRHLTAAWEKIIPEGSRDAPGGRVEIYDPSGRAIHSQPEGVLSGRINALAADPRPGRGWWAGDQSGLLFRLLPETLLPAERLGDLTREFVNGHLAHRVAIPQLALLPGGRLLSLGSSSSPSRKTDDDDVALWRPPEAQPISRRVAPGPPKGFEGHWVLSRLQLSPSGRWAIITVRDQGAQLWAIPKADD